MPRWDSNSQSQQASGRRPTRPLGPATYIWLPYVSTHLMTWYITVYTYSWSVSLVTSHSLQNRFQCLQIKIVLGSWIKIDQLDVTCFIISLFTAQHVSNVSTSIFRSLRLICWVISCVVLLWFDVCWCYDVVRLGWCVILVQAEAQLHSTDGCTNIRNMFSSK